MREFVKYLRAIGAAFFFASLGVAAHAQSRPPTAGAPAAAAYTYADLADLTDAAALVVKVEVKRQAEVEAERAPGLRPGFARLYVEAETLSLIAGSAPIGESLRYLVDVPRDDRGRVPKLRKGEFIVFAQPVPNRPSELQLADARAQLDWEPGLESRLRAILADLYSGNSLPAIRGVRDALSVAGNLAGESETQIFLETEGNRPVALSIIRRPGMNPVWGYSQAEIVDQSARPALPGSVDWYRLACFLPRSLPAEANLAFDAVSQQQAVADYAFVIAQLGACSRNRG
ncbi:hypothetical protein [Altererythrobacter sp. MF3-039]|uniref:hypothetical protein n=1 Tax=Altererythrobacter sp. MF3-039 TaxID=3252901 RepID=UPI00390C967D